MKTMAFETHDERGALLVGLEEGGVPTVSVGVAPSADRMPTASAGMAARDHLRRLRRRARSLAARSQTARVRHRLETIFSRLDKNARALEEVHRALSAASAKNGRLVGPGRWILDNYFLIREQIRSARTYLSSRRRRRSARLSKGAHDGLTDVYELALDLVKSAEGQISERSLRAYIGAYQADKPLRIAELWGLPDMLRLALIEHLTRLAVQIVGHKSLSINAEQNAQHRLAAIRPHANSLPQREGTFSPHPSSLPKEKGTFAPSAGHRHSLNKSMRNCVMSLRGLASLDWKQIVEKQSAVERILRQDPAGIYRQMKFASRNHYRSAVQRLALGSADTEESVARQAVALADRAYKSALPAADLDERGKIVRSHVGYYLVGAGRDELEKRIGYRPSWIEATGRRFARAPLGYYAGAITSVFVLIMAGASAAGWLLGAIGTAGPAVCLLLAALFAGLAAEFAVRLVNWACTLIVSPRPLMRIDYSGGIPAQDRTLVAVPALLSDEGAVGDLVRQLEVRYLANRDDNLLFALLSDFADADRETMPGDEKLLASALRQIENLNNRYGEGPETPFYLFHRPRKWNGREGSWMGEERKRGKLAALNRLLNSGERGDFSVTAGNLERLASVRYVITLDCDTRLPRDAGRELVGVMAHPLNWPTIDRISGSVVEGYAIVQPRIGATIADANRSIYSRMMAGEPGIDPYTRQTSDLYHDLFGQASYMGKGIYDVRAFETALKGRFPDNRLLSHDLIEGCFASCGLASDIELFEGAPSRYLADMNRRRRWIRGDWQIASWIGGRVPAAGEARARNSLSGLSRWKIFDNLRRSLTPVFVFGFLVVGWALAPESAGYWTLLAMSAVYGPAVLGCLPGFFRKAREKPWMLHLRDQGIALSKNMLVETFSLCVLPYTAQCHVDAIVRSLYRVYVSGRKRLEWVTAGDAEARCNYRFWQYPRLMAVCAVSGAAVATILALAAPGALVFAGPVLLAWIAGPFVAWYVSQPRDGQAISLSEVETGQIRRWARQTWHYFDTCVNAENHWLPPDNVQDDLCAEPARRTSPTNIGLGLLADVAAYDLGYLPAGELLERTQRTLHTMLRLERYRGHFYNWYDTRTLEPCEPYYVSSVDSGNLWGALVVLEAALEELPRRPAVHPRLFAGLQDTVEAISAVRKAHRPSSAKSANDAFEARLAMLRDECRGSFHGSAAEAIERLETILVLADGLAGCSEKESPAVREWTQALVRQCERARGDLLRCSADPPADAAEEQSRRIAHLLDLCRQFGEMDFAFLYNKRKKLLSIGFNVREGRFDDGYYDLLASESRLASFLAVSHGQLPAEHWFALGRIVALAEGKPALLSWSGSMFEYLMPMLVMPNYHATLLDGSCRAAVRRQIRYARGQKAPWGISESCHMLRDEKRAYHYRAFGVPGLGMQRDLANHLVIAPYASAMAITVAPREACRNLAQLEELGSLGPMGFYDAVDYTLARGQKAAPPHICRITMAHHTGMALLAMDNALLGNKMQKRFLENPFCEAHDLLLQERMPQAICPVNPEAVDYPRGQAHQSKVSAHKAQAAIGLPGLVVVSSCDNISAALP